jgi:hypothetical protein
MLRQWFSAVNGKRKQIAIHGQKYAVESTYGHSQGRSAGRKNSKVLVTEIQCFQPDFRAETPVAPVLTAKQPGFSRSFGPPDAVEEGCIPFLGDSFEAKSTARRTPPVGPPAAGDSSFCPQPR